MLMKLNGAVKARNQDLLSLWIWAVPVLLIVAALCIRQVDWYPPSVDEFKSSMGRAGWRDGPYSPIEVVEAVAERSSNHTPLFFLLLNQWGHFVGTDLTTARLLSVFCGLLSLAMVYRLARDYVEPIAGLFALVILASNTYYNFHLVHLRMYPLLVFLSALVLWLYLRVAHRQAAVNRKDYLAFGAASYLLLNTHAFAALFFATLGCYHLLFVPKNRRWIRVSLAAILVAGLYSPWLVVLVTRGADYTFSYWKTGVATVSDTVAAWQAIHFNGSLVLVAVAVAGIVFGIRAQTVSIKPYHFIALLYLLALLLVSGVTGALRAGAVNVMFPGLAPFTFLVAAAHSALYRHRRWLGALVLLWLPAGAQFLQTADWKTYHLGDYHKWHGSPWQAIVRHALASDSAKPALTYQFLPSPASRREQRFFQDFDMKSESFADLAAFEARARLKAILHPTMWLFYRTAEVDAVKAAGLHEILDRAHYQRCDAVELGIDTLLLRYNWKALNCQRPQILSANETPLIEHELYGVKVIDGGGELLFVDKWAAQEDFAHESYSISYQFIGADWEKRAQLDLPLVSEGMLRQFAIDISKAPAGNYRLMAILYDRHTGERIDWIDNPGAVSYMRNLAEIAIPEQAE